MNITAWAIDNNKVSYFAALLICIMGIFSFFKLGQLEDPEFSIKTAVIHTTYPGASAEEVELEVTDLIEQALQEMAQVNHLYSVSRPGTSTIRVDIKEEYWSDRLPQVWDEMRKKVRDIKGQLPPGAGDPVIGDDFGFVYGFVLALSSNDFDYKALEQYAESMEKNLSLVNGVSRVELWGVQPKVVYLDISEQDRKDRGVTYSDFIRTLEQQNAVVDSGYIDHGRERVRVQTMGNFTSGEDIGELLISGNPSAMGDDETRNQSLIRIKDIAEVRVGYQEPSPGHMRLNGEPAIGIAIAAQQGSNLVKTGASLEEELQRLKSTLPVGINIEKVAWQSDLVESSVNSFLISLVEAVVIVLVVLTLPMGWRMGAIIGTSLVLTILATFLLMAVLKIDLQRMSLGALIIAMGMMVDNAIVVADGMYDRLKKGMSKRQAAIESATLPAWPLLGATLIAVMAFYPIFASSANAGEYCRTLFIVVGSSLTISWLLAITITPLQCMDLLKVEAEPDHQPSSFIARFRTLLISVLKRKFSFLVAMTLLLLMSIYGFQYVKQMFFPDSSRAQFMIDVWEHSGTNVKHTSEDMLHIEAHLLKDQRVQSISAYIGMGPPRFYLPVDSEMPQSSYGQIIVNLHDWQDVDAVSKEIEGWMVKRLPNTPTRIRKYGVGPSDPWKFEARFIGTAETSTEELRQVAEQAMAVLRENPLAKDVRTDMQNPTKVIRSWYDQSQGRWSNISRNDVALASKIAHDGATIGLYRDGDDLLPIVIRSIEEERQEALDLSFVPTFSPNTTKSVPLGQVVDDLQLTFEDNAIIRWDRHRAITVQASPNNATFPTLYQSVVDELNEIPLPPGWELMWDGELDSTVTAQKSLIPGVIPALIIMVFTMVLLFNAFRPSIIIIMTIPFAVIGITLGLILLDAAFGFMALLGAMSLSGMMIKNAIVLLDQVDLELEAGKPRKEAIVSATVSRLRPVMLAAGTTVLGVIPLLQDVFWVSMAATIMFGLAFGTILTMLVVPTLYCVFYKVKV